MRTDPAVFYPLYILIMYSDVFFSLSKGEIDTVTYLHSIAFSTDLNVFGRLLRKFCMLFKASIAVPNHNMSEQIHNKENTYITLKANVKTPCSNFLKCSTRFWLISNGKLHHTLTELRRKTRGKIYLPLHQSHTGPAMMAHDWLRQCGLLLLHPCCDRSSLLGVGFHHRELPQLSQHPCMIIKL